MIKRKIYLFSLILVTFLNSASLKNDCQTAKECTEKGVQLAMNSDNKGAAEFYKIACENNDLRGCTNLGVFYEKGIIFEKNIQKASELYLKSCNQNYARGCTNLADLYQNNNDKFTVNFNTLNELYKKGCEGKHIRGCFELGKLYENNDQNESVNIYIKSCHNGYAEGCSRTGIFYANGKYVEENRLKATEYFNKGCVLKDRISCSSFAYLTILEDSKNNPNYNKAFSILSNYCLKEKDKDACNNLAVMYELGMGVKKDMEKSKKLFEFDLK